MLPQAYGQGIHSAYYGENGSKGAVALVSGRLSRVDLQEFIGQGGKEGTSIPINVTSLHRD
jgi:hypothetical protein